MHNVERTLTNIPKISSKILHNVTSRWIHAERFFYYFNCENNRKNICTKCDKRLYFESLQKCFLWRATPKNRGSYTKMSPKITQNTTSLFCVLSTQKVCPNSMINICPKLTQTPPNFLQMTILYYVNPLYVHCLTACVLYEHDTCVLQETLC